ncbi:membrane bound O-acyl transferase family protein [Nitzschia inconspicua]|uniref:Membrane bound O-acyl transferase family protein n=1 Tax=Nitzschia inconspicua TaxID=303405 RepID=A0A9K3LW08_9STRA|nr:membrane bound O-acyl transferase family protein [Nitzschia inconspicua]
MRQAAVAYLQSLFEEKMIVDDRTPVWRGQLPLLTGEFELYVPNAEGWKQLAIFVVLQSIIQVTFAAIIYIGIVQKRGTTSSYLIGWGLIMPISLYVPFYLLDLLDIRNKVMTLSATTVMTVVFFRCVEAMYGTSPYNAVMESSLWNYCGYYSSVAPFLWDTKTKRRKQITMRNFVTSLVDILLHFLAVSVVVSLLQPYRFKPFDDPMHLTEFRISWDLLSKEHLLNSYCHAVLTYLTLKAGFEATGFAENIKGFATDTIFDHPFFKSRSPTEFWTQRWNLMIQPFLKGGVFLPVKKYSNGKIAMFITFVVSGLYHEYVWLAIFYNQKYLYDENGGCTNRECYLNEFGRVTAFFIYVGIIMLLERPFGSLAPVQWLSKRLPTPIVSQFLILLHLPVAQWYIGDWVEGGYFDDFSIMTFLVRKV